jgi:hypothetical protein
MPNPENILVLCDGESDAKLFQRIRIGHPELARIPEVNITTYDQVRFAKQDTPLRKAVRPLHIDDRPDFIFCCNDKPILIVEMTKHAYTGDNGLQRFARGAVAAENRLPFIYFGPLRRVRDDELDALEGLDETAIARNLTSDIFVGMKRLTEIYGSPQLYVEWRTTENGMPMTLNPHASMEDIAGMYGELLNLIAAALFVDRKPALNELLRVWQERTTTLAGIKNTRDSDVRFLLSAKQAIGLVCDASKVCDILDGGQYFDKGKSDKLLAKFALAQSTIMSIQLPNGDIVINSNASFASILPKVFGHPKFQNPALLYYTGYKWRSDPHCGVLVNVDYRLCRGNGAKSAKERATPLIVFYPRISCNPASPQWQVLADAGPGTSALQKMFVDRYGEEQGIPQLRRCTNSKNLFSLWNNMTKQARLFRRYADIVVLNDGLILGHSLEDVFS